jgi:hypothetical protein
MQITIAVESLRIDSLNDPLMHRGIGYDQQSMHVEAVQADAGPTREGLVRDFMKIECRLCGAAYHLFHDGVGLNVLRDYFLQASWEISRQHPNHRRVISLPEHSSMADKRAS